MITIHFAKTYQKENNRMGILMIIQIPRSLFSG
jgi:hypothetical protein